MRPTISESISCRKNVFLLENFNKNTFFLHEMINLVWTNFSSPNRLIWWHHMAWALLVMMHGITEKIATRRILEICVCFIPYFRLLVFGILVTSVTWFSFRFFSRLAHVALKNVNKDYVTFSYFCNFVAKSDQKWKIGWKKQWYQRRHNSQTNDSHDI